MNFPMIISIQRRGERDMFLTNSVIHNVRAVSRKHALNKALSMSPKVMPIIRDLEAEGIPVTIEAKFLDTLTPGTRVRFVRLDWVVAEDVVRGNIFIQHDTLGNTFPAVGLTEHSWTRLDHIIAVL